VKQAPANITPVSLAVEHRPNGIADYLTLTKPRLNFLVVATSAAGYYLGAPSGPSILPMLRAVIGTALVAGGAAVLNQVYERDTDGLMRRTRMRPLPDGRIVVGDATAFGVALAAGGLALLTFATSQLAALLALATLVIYLAVYTPMKRHSAFATLVGAVPGALPPLIGWTAARGSFSIGGWTLFAIVFLWQIPHFMAIAWMYREDYRSAGLPMLPVIEPEGRRTGRQAVIYAALLVPASLFPTFVGVAGWTYLWIALILGIMMLALAARFAASRSESSARALFFGSITYLPLIWAAMVLNH
jgi:protoheme IX farnesyltransferase